VVFDPGRGVTEMRGRRGGASSDSKSITFNMCSSLGEIGAPVAARANCGRTGRGSVQIDCSRTRRIRRNHRPPPTHRPPGS
jgi:hypothetical protein